MANKTKGTDAINGTSNRKDTGKQLVSSMIVSEITDALTRGVAAATIAHDSEVEEDATSGKSSTTKRGSKAHSNMFIGNASKKQKS